MEHLGLKIAESSGSKSIFFSIRIHSRKGDIFENRSRSSVKFLDRSIFNQGLLRKMSLFEVCMFRPFQTIMLKVGRENIEEI